MFRLDALTSKVASKHEVEDKKAIFVVLESIPQVDDEWVIDLNVTMREMSESCRGDGHTRRV